jgi:hypothetical protein
MVLWFSLHSLHAVAGSNDNAGRRQIRRDESSLRHSFQRMFYSPTIDAQLPKDANSPNASDLPSESPGGDASSCLSAQIASRYQCRLSEDLADWFDSGVWKETGQNEYCDPVDPQTLLDDAPDVIWPGLMPCDFLPLIGSQAGDWLGVKFDRENRCSEIVQWYHGGGDWIPWGKTISEAIVFGAVCNRLPGPRRRHAIPADDFRESSCDTPSDPLLRWASDHVGIDHQQIVDVTLEGIELANTLLQHDIAEVAVRCELVQSALAESLSDVLNHRTAQALGIDWPTAVRWMFDNEQIPDAKRQRLESRHGYKPGARQDWQLAQQHALAITKSAPNIAWGWDLLGYCHEKAQRTDAAIAAYRQGVMQSVFSDQSVKLRTHWTAKTGAKFSASRLMEMCPNGAGDGNGEISAAYLAALTDGTQVQRRVAVKDYWLAVAKECTAGKDRYDALMAAGWDLGAEPLTAFADILSEVSQSDAAQTARMTLAETHRECMRQRYGI